MTSDNLRRQNLPKTLLRDLYKHLDVHNTPLHNPYPADMGSLAPGETLTGHLAQELAATLGFA